MTQSPVLRHKLIDRILHWLFALCIFSLLLTGLLPQFGLEFDWVDLHWISGLLLLLFTIGHVLRSLLVKSLRSMLPEAQDFTRALPGKYSLSQKLMHNAVALITLAGLITGILLTVRIDTPFWERNPYWLSASSWGLIYVVHGLVALGFVSVIMLHIYFALRPEKRLYLRSIVTGKISKQEYLQEHDPARWPDTDKQQ